MLHSESSPVIAGGGFSAVKGLRDLPKESLSRSQTSQMLLTTSCTKLNEGNSLSYQKLAEFKNNNWNPTVTGNDIIGTIHDEVLNKLKNLFNEKEVETIITEEADVAGNPITVSEKKGKVKMSEAECLYNIYIQNLYIPKDADESITRPDTYEAFNPDDPLHYIYALSEHEDVTAKLEELVEKHYSKLDPQKIKDEIGNTLTAEKAKEFNDLNSSMENFYDQGHTVLVEYVLGKFENNLLKDFSSLLRDKENINRFKSLFKMAILSQSDQSCVNLLKLYKPNAELLQDILNENVFKEILYFTSLLAHKKNKTLEQIKDILKDQFTDLLQNLKDQKLLKNIVDYTGSSLEIMNELLKERAEVFDDEDVKGALVFMFSMHNGNTIEKLWDCYELLTQENDNLFLKLIKDNNLTDLKNQTVLNLKKAIIEKINYPNNEYSEDKIFSDLDSIKDILKFENGNIRFQLRIPELVKINKAIDAGVLVYEDSELVKKDENNEMKLLKDLVNIGVLKYENEGYKVSEFEKTKTHRNNSQISSNYFKELKLFLACYKEGVIEFNEAETQGTSNGLIEEKKVNAFNFKNVKNFFREENEVKRSLNGIVNEVIKNEKTQGASNDSIEKEKVNESECVITKECYLENEITDPSEDGTVKQLNAIKEFKILKDAIDKGWLKLEIRDESKRIYPYDVVLTVNNQEQIKAIAEKQQTYDSIQLDIERKSLMLYFEAQKSNLIKCDAEGKITIVGQAGKSAIIEGIDENKDLLVHFDFIDEGKKKSAKSIFSGVEKNGEYFYSMSDKDTNDNSKLHFLRFLEKLRKAEILDDQVNTQKIEAPSKADYAVLYYSLQGDESELNEITPENVDNAIKQLQWVKFNHELVQTILKQKGELSDELLEIKDKDNQRLVDFIRENELILDEKIAKERPLLAYSIKEDKKHIEHITFENANKDKKYFIDNMNNHVGQYNDIFINIFRGRTLDEIKTFFEDESTIKQILYIQSTLHFTKTFESNKELLKYYLDLRKKDLEELSESKDIQQIEPEKKILINQINNEIVLYDDMIEKETIRLTKEINNLKKYPPHHPTDK